MHTILEDLKKGLTNITKNVNYLSNCSSGQFKNRFKLENLVHREPDFGCAADW